MNRFTSRQKIPPFGETVVYPNFLERPILISLLKFVLFYLFVSTLLYIFYSVFNEHFLLSGFSLESLVVQTRITLQRTAYLYAEHWSASGLIPRLSSLGGSNSNHSPTYRVLICRALKRFGFDPATFVAWWAQVDSNHRPRAYQARALTTWAMSPLVIRCISYLSPLVEMMGFEPMTPCLQGRCSPNWATPPYFYEVSRSLKIEQHRVNYSA